MCLSIGIKGDNSSNFKNDRKGPGLIFKSTVVFESSIMEEIAYIIL